MKATSSDHYCLGIRIGLYPAESPPAANVNACGISSIVPLPRTRDGRIVQLDLENAPQFEPAFSPSGPPLLSTELKDLTSQSNFDICRQAKNGLGPTQKEADKLFLQCLEYYNSSLVRINPADTAKGIRSLF